MTTLESTDATKTQSRTSRILLLGLFLSLSAAAFSGMESAAYAADNTGAAGSSAVRDGDKAHGHRGPKDAARLIQRFDTNKDGKLAVAELPERKRERLGKADTNKDGFLSVEEIRARGAAHAKARFARMDKDGNGALTASELGEKRWAHLKVADTNSDGKLTADELRAAHAAGKLNGARHGKRGEHGKANNTGA